MPVVKVEIDALLAENFKALAASKPIEKITIKEITDKAGVIRPTFYNHFQDKYELMEWIIRHELMDPIRPLLDNHMINAAVLLLLVNIEKDKKYYRAAAKLEGQDTFESIASKCVAEEIDRIMPDGPIKAMDHPWLNKNMIASYFARNMCMVVVDWINSNFAVPAQEMAQVYELLMCTALEDFLEE